MGWILRTDCGQGSCSQSIFFPLVHANPTKAPHLSPNSDRVLGDSVLLRSQSLLIRIRFLPVVAGYWRVSKHHVSTWRGVGQQPHVYLVKLLLETWKLDFLDDEGLVVQVFDDVIMLLLVDLKDDGFDRRIAFD